MKKGLTRRRALQGIGIGLGSAALGVGCGDGNAPGSGGPDMSPLPPGPPDDLAETPRDAGPAPHPDAGEPPDLAPEPDARTLLGAIDTIVVLMMENRSFDHYLGSLSLSEGRPFDGLTGQEWNPD